MTKLSDYIFSLSDSEYRQCMVNQKKAFFHKWIEEEALVYHFDTHMESSQIINIAKKFREDNIVPPYIKTTTIKTLYALVEFEDGSIGKVKPEDLYFLDGKELFDGYDWPNEKENKDEH